MVLLAEFHYFLLGNYIKLRVFRLFLIREIECYQHSYNYKCQKQIENGGGGWGGGTLVRNLAKPPQKKKKEGRTNHSRQSLKSLSGGGRGGLAPSLPSSLPGSDACDQYV